jgi:glycosyltransferase involved in cell wall biosynthesis
VRLACVIPATDRPPSLGRCLEAITGAGRPPDELVVVTEPSGTGPAGARNAGARRTAAEVIAFVDSDVLLHPDAFARIRAAFEADPDLGAVFGAYDDDPEPRDPVSSFRNLLHHRVHVEGAGETTTFWAGLGAVRREAFEAAGAFDAERFPHPSVEDIDLGMRMASSRERIRLDPAIRGTHLKRWGLGEMVRTDFSRRGVPWARLLLERGGGPPTALNLGWRHRVGAAASLVAAAAVAARRPRLAGASLLALCALNASLYRLLLDRGGPGTAAAGVGLHAVHHLTGAAAAAVAAIEYAAGAAPGPSHPRAAR